MLISISITNLKSIKEKQTFSMLAEKRIKELPENTFKEKNVLLLKSAIVYGANGSGKSNLIHAFDLVKRLVTESARNQIDDEIIDYTPFQLDKSKQESPIEIEIDFISRDLQYTYSIAFTRKRIVREILNFYPGKNPALLFERVEDARIKFGATIKQDLTRIEESLYANQLFLSKVGSEKIETLIPAYTFFRRHVSIYNTHAFAYDDIIVQTLTNGSEFRADRYLTHNITELLKVADIGIRNMQFKKEEEDLEYLKNLNQDKRRKSKGVEISTTHRVYKDDVEDGEIEFPISIESTGTNKLLAVGLFLLEGIADGDVIIIDELDKSLHPFITKLLIQIVNSPKFNPKNAQLIFATHDVSLLNYQLFRRDQVHFVEKNLKGDSNYYSLDDMVGVRKNLPFEKYYMKGLFGGIPLINEYDLDFKFSNDQT